MNEEVNKEVRELNMIVLCRVLCACTDAVEYSVRAVCLFDLLLLAMLLTEHRVLASVPRVLFTDFTSCMLAISSVGTKLIPSAEAF